MPEENWRFRVIEWWWKKPSIIDASKKVKKISDSLQINDHDPNVVREQVLAAMEETLALARKTFRPDLKSLK
jgi:uncharacterized protein (DUF2249 family)